MVRCICDGEEFAAFSHDSWVVNQEGKLVAATATFGRCQRCGLVRQLDLPFTTKDEYLGYYYDYPPTYLAYETKNWEHDLSLARLRCDAYCLAAGRNERILDVGSGSGAFVHECRQRGYDAFGCELSKYAYAPAEEYTYRKPFEEVNFPVDYFDLVTCHDVLEHVLDPVAMLKEIFRVTDQGGKAIIDIPHFFSPAGNHHWKHVEHIWYFTIDQLRDLLIKVGFVVREVRHPIPSKAVFYCEKPKQDRVSILVPPGVGDSYWSFVKMQSFMKWASIGIPNVTPVSNKEMKYQGHRRSIPFIEMFPFMCPSGDAFAADTKFKMVWDEAYAKEGRTLFKNVGGHHFFLSFNGHLRVGKQLEEIAPHLDCNWHPPMFVSLDQEKFRLQCQQQHSRYIVYYLPFYGTYQYWLNQFPLTNVVETIKQITRQTGCKPVFVGAQWDADDTRTRQVMAETHAVNMTGKTTLAQAFGMLRGAEAVVGFPSGMTIMAAALYCKTLIIWNSYYNKDFAWYAVPPDTRRTNYFIDFTYKLPPERVISQVKELVETGTIDCAKYPMLPEPPEATPPRQRSTLIRHRPNKVHQNNMRELIPVGEHKDPVTILCVLKSGGEYTTEYVLKLRNGIARHTTINYRFVCLTDVKISDIICESIPLTSDLAHWWAKLEMFRPDLIKDERLVYFDLDTVIVGNIDPILRLDVDFAALGAWHDVPDRSDMRHFGSGMMMWKNNGTNYNFLYTEYDRGHYKNGDQEYIARSLVKHGEPYLTLQDIVPGIYSYKRNCLRGVPADARVVCFHGRPRPHQAAPSVKWVRNNWR